MGELVPRYDHSSSPCFNFLHRYLSRHDATRRRDFLYHESWRIGRAGSDQRVLFRNGWPIPRTSRKEVNTTSPCLWAAGPLLCLHRVCAQQVEGTGGGNSSTSGSGDLRRCPALLDSHGVQCHFPNPQTRILRICRFRFSS